MENLFREWLLHIFNCKIHSTRTWAKTNSLRNPVRIDFEINLKNYLKNLTDGIEDKYNQLVKTYSGDEEVTPLYLKNYCFTTKPNK